MTITTALLQVIRADIDAALAPVLAKHGLQSLKCGNGSYSPDRFSFKVEGLAPGGKDEFAQIYENTRRYDPSLPELGTTFKHGRDTFAVAGMKRSGNILAKRVGDGKMFRFPDSVVKLLAHPRAMTPGTVLHT